MAETWDAYVRRVLDQHGLTNRGQRTRTGIPHSTINGWSHGIPPSVGSVIAFARGFGEDVDAALEIAGHQPMGPPKLTNEQAAIVSIIHNRQARRHRDNPPPVASGEAPSQMIGRRITEGAGQGG